MFSERRDAPVDGLGRTEVDPVEAVGEYQVRSVSPLPDTRIENAGVVMHRRVQDELHQGATTGKRLLDVLDGDGVSVQGVVEHQSSAWEMPVMDTPRTPEELTTQIEQLIEQYVDQSRRAACDAVERAFGSAQPQTGKVSKRGTSTKAPRRSGGQRRSPEQIEQLAQRLYEAVRAQPGESMVVLAASLEMTVRDLQLPMTRLKEQGRVRSVGKKHRTRYFPSVGSKTAKAAS